MTFAGRHQLVPGPPSANKANGNMPPNLYTRSLGVRLSIYVCTHVACGDKGFQSSLLSLHARIGEEGNASTHQPCRRRNVPHPGQGRSFPAGSGYSRAREGYTTCCNANLRMFPTPPCPEQFERQSKSWHLVAVLGCMKQIDVTLICEALRALGTC